MALRMDLVDIGILVVVFVVESTETLGLSSITPVFLSLTRRTRRTFQSLRPLRCERGPPTLMQLGLHPPLSPFPPPLQPPLNNAVLRNLLNSARSVLDPGIRSRTAGTNSLVNVVLEWVTLQSVSHSVFPHLDLTSKNPELDQSLLHRDTQLNLNLSFEFLPVLPRPLSVCPCLSLKPS